ncbi:acetyl-CoA carboxylase, biotin carboxyl carrier protein [Helicobacter valdiviensis]|uniref:Biotin carboxyl carrier protein of acetyl-CoA carboxylase n=1 Tax=Helicobacter valdiviensis TaxID=1458358 RepID=A0A2W6MVI0_9HELI|nr:acetyl-CoA carboxylase biotin carboxyl carrier protein [Helicobacter valdiviensis]PZT48352.1 acetyl-CoA carboxylase, biotin carboxyl carrier protein [Helicobacter valdiviensis]
MDFKEIKELIKIFDASNLNTLSIVNENSKIKLEKGLVGTTKVALESPSVPALPQVVAPMQAPQAPQTAQQNTTPAVSGESVNSPMVGTFYRCPSPDAPAYVNVGDKVKKGQTLAIIEAMKIMNEIEAEFDCVIKEIVPSDGQPVEYNSPLFVVEKI